MVISNPKQIHQSTIPQIKENQTDQSHQPVMAHEWYIFKRHVFHAGSVSQNCHVWITAQDQHRPRAAVTARCLLMHYESHECLHRHAMHGWSTSWNVATQQLAAYHCIQQLCSYTFFICIIHALHKHVLGRCPTSVIPSMRTMSCNISYHASSLQQSTTNLVNINQRLRSFSSYR